MRASSAPTCCPVASLNTNLRKFQEGSIYVAAAARRGASPHHSLPTVRARKKRFLSRGLRENISSSWTPGHASHPHEHERKRVSHNNGCVPFNLTSRSAPHPASLVQVRSRYRLPSRRPGVRSEAFEAWASATPPGVQPACLSP